MFSEGLQRIKARILSANTYLNEGYCKAHYVADKGVFVEKMRVFPMDTKGNYFYLRVADKINTSQQDIGINMSMPVTCVVCAKDADAEQLAYNIMQTLLNGCDSVSITSIQLLRDDVVRSELRGTLKDEELKKALANMGDWTIISVSFNLAISALPKKLTCITNPCKC